MNDERVLRDGRNEAGEGAARRRAFEIIFMSDTPAGKVFDLLLIILITTSVIVVMLDSVETIRIEHHALLDAAEWGFTTLFTIEYLTRLWCVRRAGVYARGFYGIVDLLSVLPMYVELFLSGAGTLLVIRVLRLLRLFRILKLSRYVGAADTLVTALRQSRRKILVFLFAVLTLVTVFGSLMYLIEGPQHGYTSIPRGVYWAIVTLTTVGYGDITPSTTIGQAISSLVMILGYGIIAVPTGIYAAELRDIAIHRRERIACPECAKSGHDEGAKFCNKCGANLRPSVPEEST
jgi:voltage-gated potassium channel